MRVIFIKTDNVPSTCNYLTNGKEYMGRQESPLSIELRVVRIISDSGTEVSTLLTGCAHLDDKDWEVVRILEV
jgi:hypothetical protein